MDFSQILGQVENYLASAQVHYFYWFIALLGSLIFLIQLLMTIFGFGGEDMDANGDGDISFGEHVDSGFAEFRFFSLRAVISFIAFFGWGGVLWGKAGWGGFFGALACGFFMMFATAFLIFLMLKLQQSGNIYKSDYIGCSGTVYLSVPPGRTESGKVTVSVNGSRREITAVADEELPTGTAVIVESILDGKRYLVRKV